MMDRNGNQSRKKTKATEQVAVRDRFDSAGGEDDYIKRVGSSLVHYLFTASKTIQLHHLNNEAVQRTLRDLIDVIRNIIQREGQARLRVTTEYLYVNDSRVPMDTQTAGTYIYLIDEISRRGTESIEFHENVQLGEIGVFLQIFFQLDESEGVFDDLQAAMLEMSIQNIDVCPWIDRERNLTDTLFDQKNVRKRSREVFYRTVHMMSEILQAIENKHVIQVKKAKRLTQQMTDIIQTDESILLGLASIKDFDEYTYAHSVNVCILSMLIGDRLLLEKKDIPRLGVAALFHDIGKVHIPTAIVSSDAALADSDWELMKYHTFFGAIELARVKALNEMTDAMFAALQHHVHYDMNGYPLKPNGWNLRLFTRIVTIADYYDAMTSSRTYRKIPVTPDRALRFILEKSGRIFDPVVVKAFIRAMGIYPVGSIVELDTGDIGVVVKQNQECRCLHRPTVQLVSSSGGEGEVVDLAERSTGQNRYRRTVARTIHDRESGINKHSIFATE
jgi:HD-GYP domain-containing protein (c-di-GMP phosphodiesterase class II)